MHRIFSFRVIFFLLLLAAMDLSWTPFLKIGAARPVLLYLMILYAAFQWTKPKTLALAVIVGLTRDLTSSQLIGIETLSLISACILLELTLQKIEHDVLPMKLGIIFLFVFLTLLVNLILTAALTDSIPFSMQKIGEAFGYALYTTVLSLVFFNLAARWFNERAALKQYELFK